MSSQTKYADFKTSPFDNFHFEGKKVYVHHENMLQQLLMIDTLNMDAIVKAFINNEGRKWMKRIREDLVEGLHKMGHKPYEVGAFKLLDKDGNVNEHTSRYTKENRSKARDQNKEEGESEYISSITLAGMNEDLDNFKSRLLNRSSYVGLNGFDAIGAIDKIRNDLDNDSVSVTKMRIALAKIFGQVGDRHSYIREDAKTDKKYLPFVVAPLEGKVVALLPNSSGFELFNKAHPYLKAIDGIPINDILKQINIEEIKAPEKARFTRAVMKLKSLEENFEVMNLKLPSNMEYTFSDHNGNDEVFKLSAEIDRRKYPHWTENIPGRNEMIDVEEYSKFFKNIQDDIAYIRMPSMANSKIAPQYFGLLNAFMKDKIKSNALIIDIRNNTGGTRHLMMEMAKYIIHSDSSYVVNVAQQRSDTPLTEDTAQSLYNRFLFDLDNFDAEEKLLINDFLKSFTPKYELEKDKYSPYHFTVLNGKKLKSSNFFEGHIYILMNERCFSAASVFAAVFKGLPNVTLAGVNTDGSSGNSEKFVLPNSMLNYKISTMVSFQKDGKLLDGIGTEPDIYIPRDLNQILWKKDSQLESLVDHIKTKS